MEDELFNAVKLLREYCDGGTSCENCKIKNMIHCNYEEDFQLSRHAPAPCLWSEYNE